VIKSNFTGTASAINTMSNCHRLTYNKLKPTLSHVLQPEFQNVSDTACVILLMSQNHKSYSLQAQQLVALENYNTASTAATFDFTNKYSTVCKLLKSNYVYYYWNLLKSILREYKLL